MVAPALFHQAVARADEFPFGLKAEMLTSSKWQVVPFNPFLEKVRSAHADELPPIHPP